MRGLNRFNCSVFMSVMRVAERQVGEDYNTGSLHFSGREKIGKSYITMYIENSKKQLDTRLSSSCISLHY